jgi:lipid A oxidase
MFRIYRQLVAAAAVTLLATGVARADMWAVSVYGGWNGTHDSDVRFTGPDTDWTVQSVPWDGLSFTYTGKAPYYGARLTYWPDMMPGWGFAVDFTHAKVQAKRDTIVNFEGTVNNIPYTGSAVLSDLFDVLEFTDGFNLITLNALHKLQPYGMVQPYLGAGVGFSIPHVEVTGRGVTSFPRTFAYEFGGPAIQGLIGAEVAVSPLLSLFGEYKLSWTSINSPMTGGYRVRTHLVTHHLLAGASLRFGG